MIKFRNYQNRAKTEVSPAGEHIYKWEYVDLKGEIQQDERDVYAQIQSGFRITDYKSRIAEGVLEVGNNNDNLYVDTTKLGSSYDDIDAYLNELASRVAELKKSNTESPTADIKSGETAEQGTKTTSSLSGAQKTEGTEGGEK